MEVRGLAKQLGSFTVVATPAAGWSLEGIHKPRGGRRHTANRLGAPVQEIHGVAALVRAWRKVVQAAEGHLVRQLQEGVRADLELLDLRLSERAKLENLHFQVVNQLVDMFDCVLQLGAQAAQRVVGPPGEGPQRGCHGRGSGPVEDRQGLRSLHSVRGENHAGVPVAPRVLHVHTSVTVREDNDVERLVKPAVDTSIVEQRRCDIVEHPRDLRVKRQDKERRIQRFVCFS
mmetsp:Transcript_27797/g.64118  ORF Transcript_27797/g.64118 Transcript_27797/m.64118 type:complete len:231 (-) Transcript_27797:244-936(-)